MSDDTRETIPITSPLAVLTTRTTQEHLMTTHSTTDLKPGDIVQHPEHGYGVVLKNFPGVPTIYFAGKHGYENTTRGFTGWERVETVRPGHVQVRVDDLDPQTLSEWSQYAGCNLVETALLRVGCASIARQAGQGDPTAQRAESTPPADEPEIVGDGCECWVTPEHMWTTHYGAVEPGSQVEKNPRCPKHGDKPTSATVTLYCPDCGGEIARTALVWKVSQRERTLAWAARESHTCPPAQPDEPTEFGARVTVTLPDGTREKWCRLGKHHPAPWLGETYEVPGEAWSLLCRRGTVTLGWDE